MVYLPKYVSIHNPRLGHLDLLLKCVAIFIAVFKSVLEDRWHHTHDRTHDMDISTWVENLTKERTTKAFEQASGSALCKDPSRYAYWWDADGADGAHAFDDASCARYCDAPEHHEDELHGSACVGLGDLYHRTLDDKVFINTYFKERRDDGQPGEQRFVPGAEHFRIGFSHVLGTTLSSRFHETELKTTTASGTLHLMKNGEVHETVPQGTDSVDLSLKQLLDLAGVPDILDAPKPSAGVNKKPGAAIAEGPIARISGLELAINIDCQNKDDTDEVECKLSVSRTKKTWVSRDGGSVAPGVSRIYYGVVLEVSKSAHFRYPNYSGVLRLIMDILVLIRLAPVLTTIVASRMLGGLSNCYRRTLYENFDLREQIAGHTMRLLSDSVNFVELSEKVEATRGITNARVYNGLKKMIGTGILQDGEMQNLADFCFHQACELVERPYSGCKDFLYNSLLPCLSAEKDNARRDNAALYQKEFTACLLNGDAVSLWDVQHLFNVARKRPCLERLFTPQYLVKACHYKKHAVKVMQTEGLGMDRSNAGSSTGSQESKNQVLELEVLENCDFKPELELQVLEKNPLTGTCEVNGADMLPSSSTLRLEKLDLEERSSMAQEVYDRSLQLQSTMAGVLENELGTAKQVNELYSNHKEVAETTIRLEEKHQRLDGFLVDLAETLQRLAELTEALQEKHADLDAAQLDQAKNSARLELVPRDSKEQIEELQLREISHLSNLGRVEMRLKFLEAKIDFPTSQSSAAGLTARSRFSTSRSSQLSDLSSMSFLLPEALSCHSGPEPFLDHVATPFGTSIV